MISFVFFLSVANLQALHALLANLFAGGSGKMLPNRSKDEISVASQDNYKDRFAFLAEGTMSPVKIFLCKHQHTRHGQIVDAELTNRAPLFFSYVIIIRNGRRAARNYRVLYNSPSHFRILIGFRL